MPDNNSLKEKKHLPLNQYKRKGKILSPPYEFLQNIESVAWDRDLIPEYLWMEALHQKFGNLMILHQNFNKFLDLFDSYINDEDISLLGLITDFGKVPNEKREEILKNNYDIIKELFVDIIGHVIVLYPDCPAVWLIPNEEKETFKKNHEYSVKKVIESVIRLYPGKESEYCRELRILPLQRLLKYERLSFRSQVKWPRLLLKYPYQLSTKEKEHCERMAILTLNMYIEFPGGSKKRNYQWSKHFWRCNLRISPCISDVFIKKVDTVEITKKFIEELNKYMDDNIKSLKNYLFEDLRNFEYDLYDTIKDEVVIGIFSRIVRLYITFLKAPELWTRDISNIFIRCILDSSIVLKYLLKQNDINLFQKFIDYGRGKEKLQILHSQDTYPNENTAGSENSKELATELGSDFFIESLEINLGNWIDKSARDMAIELNMQKEYALIYNPTSEDIHGSWLSIKKSSLMNCMNPLHRFHRIPRIYEPLDHNLFDIMTNIVQDIIKICEKQYNFPRFNYKIKKIQDLVKKESL